MTELRVLKPVTDPPAGGTLLRLAPRGGLVGKRLVVVDNGKPRATELLSAVADGLASRFHTEAFSIFSKPGASQPISAQDVADIAISADVVLTGLGDCGGCSACSLQDALLMEQAGRPATVVISEPFQGRIAGYAAKLGAPGYGTVVVPHPVASRSADYLKSLADEMVDYVAIHLGGAAR